MANGSLFLVATPIGHLDDITQRALNTLGEVDLIAAEDTRHTKRLLSHYGIKTRLLAYHDHNDEQATPGLIAQLTAGKDIALVSDAGTPLISDPGYPLVRAAHAAGIRVIPIPGACAAISALSASGIPSQPFEFIGFLPPSGQKRASAIAALVQRPHTSIVYESVHRIQTLIEQLNTALEPSRSVCIARELTKQYESILTDTIAHIASALSRNDIPLKGEFVVIIAPAPAGENTGHVTLSQDTLLTTLLNSLSLSDAVALYCQLTGEKRNAVYQRALDQS